MKTMVAITGFSLLLISGMVVPYIRPEGVGFLVVCAMNGLALLLMALAWSWMETLSRKLPWEFRLFYLGVETFIVGFMLAKVYSEVAFFLIIIGMIMWCPLILRPTWDY